MSNGQPAASTSAHPLMELRDVSKSFTRAATLSSTLRWVAGRAASRQTAPVQAVSGVNLRVHSGEVLGLVGESGCGKSTLGRVVVGLHRATAGQRLYRGEVIDGLHGREALSRQLELQMVFQDPYASLNPRLRVHDIVGEAPVVHGVVALQQKAQYVAELLDRVGLRADMANRFPHQFSGGQRARIGIARALAVNPKLVVCDEAVAALDVSVQAQVLNLLMELRGQLGLSYVFISHNLAVVQHIADRVAVMYLGRIVETGTVAEIFGQPAHPYTRALLAESPTLKVGKKRFVSIRGEMPSPMNPPSGCHFHPRCPIAVDRCKSQAPVLRAVGAGHEAACHLLD